MRQAVYRSVLQQGVILRGADVAIRVMEVGCELYEEQFAEALEELMSVAAERKGVMNVLSQ